MELFENIIKEHFTWGLLLGLLIAAFIWKAGFTARRNVSRDLRRVEEEMKNLNTHLNTQLKINASGNEALQSELQTLRSQNETLRMNNAALQQKPGRAEQRLLQVHEIAIRTMREQAPGFAAAWEKALRQGEAELEASESGLKKLMRRVIPGMGNSQAPATLTMTDELPPESQSR